MFSLSAYTATSRQVTTEDADFLLCRSSNVDHFTGYVWLLAPAPQYPPSLPASQMADGRWPMPLLRLMTKLLLSCRHLSLTAEQISLVEVATRGQRDNPNWAVYRQGRITSSNFGSVLQCLRSGRGPSQSPMKTLVAGYDLTRVHAIQCVCVGGGGGCSTKPQPSVCMR